MVGVSWSLESGVLTCGALLVWALALYVASRGPTRRASRLAAAAMTCLAAYLTGEALGALAPDLSGWSQWLRRTWWAPSLAAPFWLLLSLVLVDDEGPPAASAWAHRTLLPAAF